MYIHIIDCIYVYVHTTYICKYLCTCTYMDIRVHKIMNMYIHVCTMFRHVYTVLPYPVQGGRIPDAAARRSSQPQSSRCTAREAAGDGGGHAVRRAPPWSVGMSGTCARTPPLRHPGPPRRPGVTPATPSLPFQSLRQVAHSGTCEAHARAARHPMDAQQVHCTLAPQVQQAASHNKCSSRRGPPPARR